MRRQDTPRRCSTYDLVASSYGQTQTPAPDQWLISKNRIAKAAQQGWDSTSKGPGPRSSVRPKSLCDCLLKGAAWVKQQGKLAGLMILMFPEIQQFVACNCHFMPSPEVRGKAQGGVVTGVLRKQKLHSGLCAEGNPRDIYRILESQNSSKT